MKHSKLIISVFCLAIPPLLISWSSVGTAIKHKDLETSVQMSESIFIDELAGTKKSIFIKARNTTDDPNFKISGQLKTALQEQGYSITNDASNAGYVLQVQILRVGKMSETASEEMLGWGYGGTYEGGHLGSHVGEFAAESTGKSGYLGSLGGEILGSLAGSVASNAVKNVTYSGVVDLSILQKTPQGRHHYATRILISANQTNLKFKEAEKLLEDGLVTSISGLF